MYSAWFTQPTHPIIFEATWVFHLSTNLVPIRGLGLSWNLVIGLHNICGTLLSMAQWLGKIRSKGSIPPAHRKSWAQHWANSHSGQGKNFVFLCWLNNLDKIWSIMKHTFQVVFGCDQSLARKRGWLLILREAKKNYPKNTDSTYVIICLHMWPTFKRFAVIGYPRVKVLVWALKSQLYWHLYSLGILRWYFC